jgi:translation initiation factor 2B subunit (eIF-2B alpha/beta/delta family)/NAD-dependent SIR2 family protein deacetylase
MVTIEEMVKSLSKEELVVFIGAGVSKGVSTQRGVPAATELIEIFANEFPCIKENEDYKNNSLRFELACQIIKREYGFGRLIDLLCSEINLPAIKPMPAHKLLAKLPFSAYFTTNFDTLLEQAYANVNDKYHVIIEDRDVPFLKSGHVPIIKLHGCVTRKQTMIAAIEDYKPFKKSKPLIDACAKMFLSSKQILFLGFSLKDPDFIELYDEIKNLLGDFMRRNLAVVQNSKESDKTEWDEKGITLIDQDLTVFLNQLALKNSHVCDFPNIMEIDKSSYMNKLHEVTDCPTETMAIDVFLNLLRDEINSDITQDIIINEFEKGYKAVLHNKPNFLAFQHECEEIVNHLRRSTNKNEMLQFLNTKIADRLHITTKINRFSSDIIKPSSQILIYSQSIRVLEFLKSLTFDVQRSCILYICECRAKSPHPFYDALQILDQLNGTQYKICLITDSSISYLMKTNQINCVLMGAHAVYIYQKKMIKFVNTSGSESIVRDACCNNIPIYIIAENKKTKEWTTATSSETKYEEGYFITKPLMSQIRDMQCIEIAYDLCDRTQGMVFISEDLIDA